MSGLSKILLSACAVLPVCRIADADSAMLHTSTDGRTVVPLETTAVAMTAETVMVTPSGAAFDLRDPVGLRVDCVFHFVNNGDEPATSEMGFPFESLFAPGYMSRDYLEFPAEAGKAAGFAPLLPMVAQGRDWREPGFAMFEADPPLEARYLAVLSHLEDSVLHGSPPANPAIRSLFGLTGWFVEGMESPALFAYSDYGFPSGCRGTDTISWWTDSSEVPLIRAEVLAEPLSAVPFAYQTPSPPFPPTPQVNSVLNDGDLLTGWRSGLEDGSHGEILEVFIFPLPGMEPTILHGFCLVNGFGWEPGLPRGHLVRVLVSVDGSPVCTAELAEGPAWQRVEFPEALEGARALSLEIIESVPGGAGSAAGISEMRLY